MIELKMIPVDSSAIAEIGYEDGMLTICFRSRRELYSFPNVPEQIFKDFLQAPSKGKFYNENIRDIYLPLP